MYTASRLRSKQCVSSSHAPTTLHPTAAGMHAPAMSAMQQGHPQAPPHPGAAMMAPGHPHAGMAMGMPRPPPPAR